MSFTRRTFLRNSALISAAGAASPFLVGCKQKKSAHSIIGTGASGMNIFFEGSWLFTGAGASKGYMYAIARDMYSGGNPCVEGSTMKPVHHTFPFGGWTGSEFDVLMPGLTENTRDSNHNLIPYTITVNGFAGGSGGVFSDTFNKRSGRFVYIPNSQSNLQVDLAKCGLRVISVPIPTAIVPCGFVTNAVIKDLNHNLLQQDNSKWTNTGVATTHIFQYAGGASAAFNTDTVTTTVTSPMDLHFHAVPSQPQDENHASDMFQHLISLIYGVSGSTQTYLGSQDLVYTGGMTAADPGTDATTLKIDPTELDILYAKDRDGDVASCASGGIGLGGGGCC